MKPKQIVFTAPNGIRQTFDVYPEGKWVFIDEHRNQTYTEEHPSIDEWMIWNHQDVEKWVSINRLTPPLKVKMVDPYDDSVIEESEVYI